MHSAVSALMSLAFAALMLAAIVGSIVLVVSFLRRPTKRSTEDPRATAAGQRPVVTLPRPDPLERHRLDPIAFVLGLLTIIAGGIGLGHQLGAYELGPGAVAVILAGLIGLGTIVAIVVWPRTKTVIEDPRLVGRGPLD